ncbi:MAG: response regulator [Candidatus Zhuqueibacterota bacterium]
MSVKTILIVDDEDFIRSLLDSFLSRQGFVVLQAKDGIEAAAIIKQHPLDLIFLDIQLPAMNGMQILKMVKELNSDIPVIMISGNVSEEIALETLKLGAFDYIKKPVDLHKVTETICCVELLCLAAE